MQRKNNFNMENNSIKRYSKLITVLAIVFLCIFAVVLGVKLHNKKANKENNSSNKTVVEETKEEKDIFISGGVKEVDDLIKKYYDAILNSDANTLYALCDRQADDNLNVLSEKLAISAPVYDEFENITNYVAKGINDGSYIVYSSANIKFRGINTDAPILLCFYVDKKEDGTYYIKDSSLLNDEEKKLINEYDKNKIVIELDKNVRQTLASNVVSDKRFATLYSMFVKKDLSTDITFNSPDDKNTKDNDNGEINIDNTDKINVKDGKDMTEE